MINIEEYPILNHVVTLKCASKDENGGRVEYMTESQVGVINFDKIKEAYAKEKGLKNHPKSNDALYIQQGGIDIFIEFKNGYMEKRKGPELKEKIYDSLLILTDIIGESISYTREHLNYILVYNEVKNLDNENINPKTKMQDSPAREEISKSIFKLAKDRKIGFGLDKFKGYCFKEVATYTQAEFEQEFVAKISS